MRTAVVLATVLLGALQSPAGESPQFRGPARDGRFLEEGLLKTWPENGPHKAWVATGIGRGYSSASVADGKIFVTGMRDDEMGVLSVLDLQGTVVRTIDYGQETTEKQAPGARSTPTLDGDHAFILSGTGVLYCIDWSKGETVWEANILERFESQLPIWHYSESVLIDGDHVICTPGGKKGVLAALNKKTGETVWATMGLEDTASYCSPTIFQHGGKRILTTATAGHIVGVDPSNGALLWAFAHKGPYDIHGVTPIYSNGLLYYVAGDGFGGGALELSADGTSVTPKWENKTLDCLHHGVVLVDGYLYGAGYKGGGALECLEMATGNVMWSTKDVREGNVVYADGMLYVYEGPKAGAVNLVKAQPSGFERTGTFTIADGGDDKHWAHPTIANGVLYIRHGDALVAYNIQNAP